MPLYVQTSLPCLYTYPKTFSTPTFTFRQSKQEHLLIVVYNIIMKSAVYHKESAWHESLRRVMETLYSVSTELQQSSLSSDYVALPREHLQTIRLSAGRRAGHSTAITRFIYDHAELNVLVLYLNRVLRDHS